MEHLQVFGLLLALVLFTLLTADSFLRFMFTELSTSDIARVTSTFIGGIVGMAAVVTASLPLMFPGGW